MGNESMISMFSTEKMFVFNHFKRKLGKLRAEDVRGARPIRQLCDAGRRVAPSDDSSGEASAPCCIIINNLSIISLNNQSFC